MPMGKLVIDDDGTKFTDSHLWATVHHEVRVCLYFCENSRASQMLLCQCCFVDANVAPDLGHARDLRRRRNDRGLLYSS